MRRAKKTNITGEVLKMIKTKVDDEKEWINQRGYNLSSARVVNILENLICKIYELELEGLSKEEASLRKNR